MDEANAVSTVASGRREPAGGIMPERILRTIFSAISATSAS